MPAGHLIAHAGARGGAGGALAGAGVTAPDERRERPRASERVAADLGVDADRVRSALDSLRKERRAERAERRAMRAQRRGEGRSQRAERRRDRAGRRHPARAVRRIGRLRERLAADLAARLDVEPAKVTAALRARLARRLDRAVARDRLTADGREAALACFDDRAKCKGLRARLRRP